MHDGRVRAQTARALEQLDRADAVLGETLLDLAGLLVGVDVERQALGGGVPAELLEPVGRAGPDGVGGDPNRGAPAAQLLEAVQVPGDGCLAEPVEPAAGVRGEEQHDRDPRLLGGIQRRMRLGQSEIVELADRRVPGGAELPVGVGVGRAPSPGV